MLQFIDQYHLFGGIVGSILGFAFLYPQLNKSTKKEKYEITVRANGAVTVSSKKGECGSENGPDVIVFGAGVTGSALAYTLGKVLGEASLTKRHHHQLSPSNVGSTEQVFL